MITTASFLAIKPRPEGNWLVPSFAVVPGETVLLPARVGSADVSARLPDGAVALEAPSKAQLPDAVAPPDAACVLQPRQNVPAPKLGSLMADTIQQLRGASDTNTCACTCNPSKIFWAEDAPALKPITHVQRVEALQAAVFHPLLPSCR